MQPLPEGPPDCDLYAACRYMMVYSPQPFITMCSGADMSSSGNMPGTMARDGQFVLDPCLFWKPPGRGLGAVEPVGVDPRDMAAHDLGDVTGVAIGGDASLWAFYR